MFPRAGAIPKLLTMSLSFHQGRPIEISATHQGFRWDVLHALLADSVHADSVRWNWAMISFSYF